MTNNLRKIGVFGDSILKGVQLNEKKDKYIIKNNIDIEGIGQKHGLKIKNFSVFGCTIEKGRKIIERNLSKSEKCDVVIIEYGGNDCDFKWKEIGEDPDREHFPNTPIEKFVNIYKELIELIKSKGICPILTNLPPLDPQKFFDWFCAIYNKEKILEWLGSVNTIYRYQEMYSRTIEKIAMETNSLLLDLRGNFLNQRKIENLFCEDGVHPNTKGQQIITDAFMDFVSTCSKATGKSIMSINS